MKLPDQVEPVSLEEKPCSPHGKARGRRARRALLLLSAGIVGFTTIGAGTPALDRDPLAGPRSRKHLDTSPPWSWASWVGDNTPRIQVASLPTAEALPASEPPPAEQFGTRFADRLQDGLGLAVNRVAAASPAPTPAGHLFGIGDKLKITFYERVDSEDDKWARRTSALTGIQQRPELSGEYAVQEDGTISVPLLGIVYASGQPERQIQTELTEMFEKKFGRKAMINVQLQERSPVYVLGPVKNPGSFKYVPGMTVLHALALAGGFDRDRGSADPWQKIEATRTIEKRNAATDSTLKLLAREAVLRAERDGSTPKIPAKLLKLVGIAEATSLVDEQEDRRKAIAMARRERERAAQSAVESARQDLRMYARTDSLDELVKTRQERVESIRTLVDKNIAPKAQLSQVQAELSDAEQRRQDAFSQYSQAKQRLAQLENDALRARADLSNDLSIEIEAADRQIAENERELNVSNEVLGTLPATRAGFIDPKSKGVGQIHYVIVRQTPSGPVEIESQGMTVLQPGDLVNIATEPAEANGRNGTAPEVSPPASAPAAHQTLIERASQDEIGPASKRGRH